MLKYVLKRILSALVTIFFIITITFCLMKAIPGNPFAAEKMPNPEIEAAMMAKYGLDQPLWKQYIIYLGNFLRGDFGVSYTKAGLTVNKVIADGFPFSLTIGIYASLVLVIGAFPLSFITRLTRTSLVEVQQQDYIRTARSKGISEFKVIYKHALRNALLPVVTYIGPMVASIVTGSFVIETVFGIPGVGQLFTDSIVNRDYPLIMGITVFFAVLLVLAVLIVDLVYVLIDPRIKLD